MPKNTWLFSHQVTGAVDRELARTALSEELRGGQARPRPRRPATVPLRGMGGWAERGRGPAFSYPQMPARPAPHSSSRKGACADGLPMELGAGVPSSRLSAPVASYWPGVQRFCLST